MVHCGEGTDEKIRAEWKLLKDIHLAVPQTVLIHATAFQPADFAEVAHIGAKVVWSPLSNTLLYGSTTNIPAALDAGVLVSIRADWSPSGSSNLLAELKFADRVNKKLWSGKITHQQLFEMVTVNAAVAFGVDRKSGTIEVGVCGLIGDCEVVEHALSHADLRAAPGRAPGDDRGRRALRHGGAHDGARQGERLRGGGRVRLAAGD